MRIESSIDNRSKGFRSSISKLELELVPEFL